MLAMAATLAIGVKWLNCAAEDEYLVGLTFCVWLAVFPPAWWFLIQIRGTGFGQTGPFLFSRIILLMYYYWVKMIVLTNTLFIKKGFGGNLHWPELSQIVCFNINLDEESKLKNNTFNCCCWGFFSQQLIFRIFVCACFRAKAFRRGGAVIFGFL